MAEQTVMFFSLGDRYSMVIGVLSIDNDIYEAIRDDVEFQFFVERRPDPVDPGIVSTILMPKPAPASSRN